MTRFWLCGHGPQPTLIKLKYRKFLLPAHCVIAICLCMKKIKISGLSLEHKILIVLSIAFFGVMGTAWKSAMNLRAKIAANNAAASGDTAALIEIERLRNLVESQVANSRAFFLLGSKAVLDKAREDKQKLQSGLSEFQRKYNLADTSNIIKQIEGLLQEQQDTFDQGMKYREKQTESKVIGQFYQSKVSSIRKAINEKLDEIGRLHTAEFEHTKAQAKEEAMGVESQIPKKMTLFMSSVAGLFAIMALMVLRMVSSRSGGIAERDRLYEQAQKAILSRDEVISAVGHDLEDSLREIQDVADSIGNDQIKNALVNIRSVVEDIVDQKNADMNTLALRLAQLSIDEILDEAQLVMQPLARQRDIRLQFEEANPPVLAFFDKERVIRVLTNLIGNAIKFSPKHGKVVVKVRSNQQFVNISVADSGPIIPEKKMAEVFDNFWQARKTADQGAGVGLAVVKTIIEAHGGTVKVENNHGEGNMFTFSLPRRRPVGAQLKKRATTIKSVRAQGEMGEGPLTV